MDHQEDYDGVLDAKTPYRTASAPPAEAEKPKPFDSAAWLTAHRKMIGWCGLIGLCGGLIGVGAAAGGWVGAGVVVFILALIACTFIAAWGFLS